MRKIVAISLIALFAGAPAFAQTQDTGNAKPPRQAAQSWPKPIDHGPFTAQANAAYQGGGVILQGAPGAPPPQPQPTPPGQTPRNAVPQ